jgi:alpha-N-arabinofuranosidase
VDVLLAEKVVPPGPLYIKVEGNKQAYSFFATSEQDKWLTIAEEIDGRILSTPIAGGFVGTFIGMYASSNGQPSTNSADFDWFEYVGLDEP